MYWLIWIDKNAKNTRVVQGTARFEGQHEIELQGLVGLEPVCHLVGRLDGVTQHEGVGNPSGAELGPGAWKLGFIINSTPYKVQLDL